MKFKMKDGAPEPFKCDCGGTYSRESFGTSEIPEHMQAGTEEGDNFDIASNIMRNAKLPSGRDKLYY